MEWFNQINDQSDAEGEFQDEWHSTRFNIPVKQKEAIIVTAI